MGVKRCFDPHPLDPSLLAPPIYIMNFYRFFLQWGDGNVPKIQFDKHVNDFLMEILEFWQTDTIHR